MFIFGSEFFFPLCRWFSLRERIQRDRNEERASPKLKRCYETRVYICMEPKAFLKCIFSWSISNVVDSTCFIHSFRFCVCVCVCLAALCSLSFSHTENFIIANCNVDSLLVSSRFCCCSAATFSIFSISFPCVFFFSVHLSISFFPVCYARFASHFVASR